MYYLPRTLIEEEKVIEFTKNSPIYQQIMEYIKHDIVAGKLEKDEKIPSVRELAVELSVNPNTVQHALSELERENILKSKRGLGRFVTDDERIIKNMKKEEVKDLVENFTRTIKSLGFDLEETTSLVEEYFKGE